MSNLLCPATILFPGVEYAVHAGYLAYAITLRYTPGGRRVDLRVLHNTPPHRILDLLAQACTTLARDIEPPEAKAERLRLARNARRRAARARAKRKAARARRLRALLARTRDP